MTWSARQYTKFEDERTRPVRDLLAQVPTDAVASAVDIGCGPGNSTELLLARFPDAAISGMDSSSDMIAAARKRLPAIQFEVADIASWQPAAPYDVILSNAVLQWLPDHEVLMPSLMAKLAPGGTLAVQMPDNLDEPAHVLMREVAADGTWAGKLAPALQTRAARHGADWYYRALRGGTTRLDIWRTTYHHPLAGGASAVVEWFKGAALRPLLDLLDEAEREAFLARYQGLIAQAYPAMPDGTVLLPFPRLFIVATR
ncbi:trans-aconitate 2-methyltransferase [Bosea sp. 2RAB26]|uniref:trans-aconitate 2-methyltransferase n=1 Tax=Bosea sp. 2RAB26 TaxID=3237476 RepID=UPI003F8F2E5E